MWFNFKFYANCQWPLNSASSATVHMANVIMEFDFLYIVSNATTLIDTDVYL